ncbi:MAG: replication factor A [Halobacteriales archaeon]
MADIKQTAKEIHERFSEHGVELDDVESRLDNLVNEYQVPLDEARRSVESHYSKQTGVSREDRTSETAKAAEIDAPEEWVDMRVKVVELWDSDSDAVAQTGLLGDDTGRIRFTAWSKSELPALEEGRSYELENVVTDEYQGRMSVKLNSTTEITELDEDVEVGTSDVEVEGALVDVQSGSGLIKRCPEEDCTRVLQNGRCSEHGEVEGEFDLRVKAVLDDGEKVHDVLLDRERTEEVTGITMEEAKQESMDALDTSVVTDDIEGKLLGRYYHVVGPRIGRYVLVDEMTEVSGADDLDLDAVLMEARSA